MQDKSSCQSACREGTVAELLGNLGQFSPQSTTGLEQVPDYTDKMKYGCETKGKQLSKLPINDGMSICHWNAAIQP